MLAEWLGGQSAKGIAALGLSLVTLLAVIDYVTGYEATFAQFYFLPVGLVTYYAAARVGLPVALAATCAWAWVDYFSGHAYSHPLIFAWNVAARFAMFAIVVWLTDSVRSGLERERRDARADFLTGLPNGRAFDERVRAEIAGAARYGYVFSVAHIDIDGFKQVNDSYGHAAGDEVLRIVGHILATNLRANDIAARLGGDWDSVRATLEELAALPLDADQVLLLRLLQTEVLLQERRAEDALAALGNAPPETTPSGVQIRYFDDLAAAYRQLGNLLETANALQAVDALQSDPNERLQTQTEILRSLALLNEQILTSLQPSPPGTAGGWMELALLVKRYGHEPAELNTRFAAWRQQFPDHPALPELLVSYRDQLQGQMQQFSHIAVLLPQSGPLAGVAAGAALPVAAGWSPPL